MELSAPVMAGLDLSAPSPVTAALVRVLQSFCQDQLTFTSWASVSGRLTLGTDQPQGHTQLTVNIKEKVVRVKDGDICFQSESYAGENEGSILNNPSQITDTLNICGCDSSDIKDVQIKHELDEPLVNINKAELIHQGKVEQDQIGSLSDLKLITGCFVKIEALPNNSQITKVNEYKTLRAILTGGDLPSKTNTSTTKYSQPKYWLKETQEKKGKQSMITIL